MMPPRHRRGFEDGTVAFIIVEDDAAVADSLASLLAGAGHDARIFASGEDLISAGPPSSADTVVVDLGLPGISGSAVISWLDALAQRPRVVIISGKSAGMITRELARISGFSVLRKPPASDWLEVIIG